MIYLVASIGKWFILLIFVMQVFEFDMKKSWPQAGLQPQLCSKALLFYQSSAVNVLMQSWKIIYFFLFE